jgi:hypothetical protein
MRVNQGESGGPDLGSGDRVSQVHAWPYAVAVPREGRSVSTAYTGPLQTGGQLPLDAKRAQGQLSKQCLNCSCLFWGLQLLLSTQHPSKSSFLIWLTCHFYLLSLQCICCTNHLILHAIL